jgi:hypothetical protein
MKKNRLRKLKCFKNQKELRLHHSYITTVNVTGEAWFDAIIGLDITLGESLEPMTNQIKRTLHGID